MFVAVAEFASATGRGDYCESACSEAHPQAGGSSTFALHAMVLAVLALFGIMPVWSLAQIVPSGAHAPNVISTPSGLPQVNINRPSGAGVSVNSYSQFDVQKNGAILNNSPTVTNTQLAGYINGNPSYAPGQSAKIIINQVNSANASQFNGPAEIAGNAATFVLANPNGISVNGGTVINAPRAVLTTGTPNYAPDGSLAGYSINGGNITVQGAGFNASNVDQVDILARAVQINAAIYSGKALNVIAGANQVDHNNLAATPIAGNGPAPSLAIDVGQLGGMYSGKIFLASNEYGVGVSTQGVLAAQSGDLTLHSNGQLTLAGRQRASGNVALNATQGISNSGTTYAQQSLSANTSGVLANSGTLAAQGGVNAGAGSVNSTGALASGVDNNGNVTQAADLNVSASGALVATGQNVSGGNETLTGSSVNLAGSQTAANGNLTLAANGGDLNATNLSLSGAAVDNDSGTVQHAGTGTLDVGASGAVTSVGGNIASNGSANLHGASVDTSHGSTTASLNLSVQAQTITNEYGTMGASNALNANATSSLDNRNGSMVASTVTVQAGGTFDSSNGDVEADQLSISAANLLNRGGSITQYGASPMGFNVSGLFDNSAGGTFQTNATNITLAPGALVNDNGTITHAGTGKLTINASNGAGLASNVGGTIQGNGDVEIDAGALNNTAGTVLGQSGVTATVGGALDNENGKLLSNKDLNVASGTLAGTSPYIQFQANGMASAGAYAGVGGSIGTSTSNGQLTTGKSTGGYAEIDAAMGGGGGLNFSINDDRTIGGMGGSGPVRAFPGLGFGAGIGAGLSTTYTIVLPSVKTIVGK